MTQGTDAALLMKRGSRGNQPLFSSRGLPIGLLFPKTLTFRLFLSRQPQTDRVAGMGLHPDRGRMIGKHCKDTVELFQDHAHDPVNVLDRLHFLFYAPEVPRLIRRFDVEVEEVEMPDRIEGIPSLRCVVRIKVAGRTRNLMISIPAQRAMPLRRSTAEMIPPFFPYFSQIAGTPAFYPRSTARSGWPVLFLRASLRHSPGGCGTPRCSSPCSAGEPLHPLLKGGIWRFSPHDIVRRR